MQCTHTSLRRTYGVRALYIRVRGMHVRRKYNARTRKGMALRKRNALTPLVQCTDAVSAMHLAHKCYIFSLLKRTLKFREACSDGAR